MYVSGKEKQNGLLIEMKNNKNQQHINMNIILDLYVRQYRQIYQFQII